MNNHNEPLTAVDVIRCVWLAKTAAKRGDHESAQRWQAKADAWLERQKSDTRRSPLENPGQLAPESPTDLPMIHAT